MKPGKTMRSLASCAGVVLTIILGAASAQQRKPDVHFVATPEVVVEEMLKLANVGKDDVVYDLGCGDGRIVIAAAKKYGARGVGVDIDPQRIKESNENARLAGVTDRVKFIQQDLFEMDFREATVIALYLLPSLNLRLRPKLLRDLKPGARIVSFAFDMGDWKPEKVVTIPADFEKELTVYYWVVPPSGDRKN
jgi:SAM-dependent methyltransferase